MMDNGKIEEFKIFLRDFIETNKNRFPGKNIYWDSIPPKIRKNCIRKLRIPAGESLLMFFDSSLTGSGKEGLGLTDMGARYSNDGVSWCLTWDELACGYYFQKSAYKIGFGIKYDSLLLMAKQEHKSAKNPIICLYVIDKIDYDMMIELLSGVCRIFSGKIVDENTEENYTGSKMRADVNKHEEKYNTIKEKIKTFVKWLPFRSLVEKLIPANVRTRLPWLDRIIPYTNHIIIGIVIYVLLSFLPISGKPQRANILEYQTITEAYEADGYIYIQDSGGHIHSHKASQILVGWNEKFYLLEDRERSYFTVRNAAGKQVAGAWLPGVVGIGVGTDFFVLLHRGEEYFSYNYNFKKIGSATIIGARDAHVSGDVITIGQFILDKNL